MATVLQEITRSSTGAPTPSEIAHDQKGRDHFMKYCNTGKCIRGPEQAQRSSWHDNGFCMECAFNPYNMTEVQHEK